MLATGAVNMSGGEISGNSATYGGGIHVSGAEFNLTGGKITGNVAAGGTGNTSIANGGGVILTQKATMKMSGGEISDNNSAAYGGGIKVGATFAANDSNKAFLNITGGTISGNVSSREGGGVNIESGSKADVTGGTITGNTSYDGEFGGGGFYVNGDRSGYGDAVLTLKNVLITDNTAEQEGGGIAGCWTSDETVYYLNGAAIYGNHSESDFYVDTIVRGSMSLSGGGGMSATLTGHMFNGAAYNWVDVYTGETVTPAQLASVGKLIHNSKAGLKANPDGREPLSAPVTITGNTSHTRGGGIGSNGTVIIGTEPSPNPVKWTPEVSKVLYNRDMKPDEKFTFTVYEEKSSEGFNFWWTQYEDVKVGTGSVTGAKDGKPKAIDFTEIDLGMAQPSQVGKTRTFLIREDKASLPEDILTPEKYLAITVVYSLEWDEENRKEVIIAETQEIEIGKILEDGSYDYDDPSSESSLMTPTHNFGRIRSTVEKAEIPNYAKTTTIEASKEWKFPGEKIAPEGAEVTLELYRDDEPTGRIIQLDGTPDELEAGKDGEAEPWKALWVDIPVYRLNSEGVIYKIHDEDDDYARYDYAIVEKDWKPAGFTPVLTGENNTTDIQFVMLPVTATNRAVTFTNEYHAKGETTLQGEKRIENREFQEEDEWTFTVTAEDDVPMPEKTSVTISPTEGRSAQIDFGKISYTEKDGDKTYTYTSTETGTVAGVTNDSAKTVTVKVTDNGDGTLNVENSISTEPLTFVNTYHPTGKAQLRGHKVIQNRPFAKDDKLTTN